MDNEFNEELIELLSEVIKWSRNFNQGLRDYSFDIDDRLNALAVKHARDFKKGSLLLIYNLLDFYCDAVKHEFREVDTNYSISQAYEDVVEVLNTLKHKKTKIEFPKSLKERIGSL